MLDLIPRHQFHRLQALGYGALARIQRKRCFGYPIIKAHLEGQSGLEFGGPSPIFSVNHLIPIYKIARAIDCANFAQQTIWTSKGDHQRFGPHFGRQLIVEACDCSMIADGAYDFVAASHVLEHVANPLRALQEWKRLLKPSGMILVVLPHKVGMFDHRRPFTTFDHIKEDYESNVTEADLTHLQEILELHDLELDPPAGSPEQFRERCLRNISKRAMHHHVFSPELLIQIFTFLHLRILNFAVERPYHIIVYAKKADQHDESEIAKENSSFLVGSAEWRSHDPFRGSKSAQA